MRKWWCILQLLLYTIHNLIVQEISISYKESASSTTVHQSPLVFAFFV